MGRPSHTVLEYRGYELPADFPIMVLTGDRWHISPIPGQHLHFHNCLEIGICHTSGGTMVFNQQRVRFKAGDVTCIARNVPHTTWSDAGQGSLWSYLFLDGEALLGSFFRKVSVGPADFRRFLTDCHLLLDSEKHPWARMIAGQILEEMVSQEPGYQACVLGLCAALLMNMLRVYNLEDPGQVRDSTLHVLYPALDHIHEHYMQDFPLETLSALCHISPTHFRRLFREQLGTSPLQFLHQTRILKSCALLRSSELSVMEIAGAVGYNSLSSYNRQFHKAMGCPPTVWRSSSRDQTRPSLLTFTGWTEAEEIPEASSSGPPSRG